MRGGGREDEDEGRRRRWIGGVRTCAVKCKTVIAADSGSCCSSPKSTAVHCHAVL